jgi:transposase-like protein
MSQEIDHPETLVEAVAFFSDEDRAVAYLAQMRWGNTVACPRCGSVDVKPIPTRRTWECMDCKAKRQFSVRVGTVLEDSKIPVGKWMMALWMIVNAKNGISSHELARALGVTQKTAWFLGHRIRLALQTGTFETKMAGPCEVDETYIGGRARNMHAGRRKAKGRGSVGKAVVMGLLERHGEVRLTVVPNTKRGTLQPEVRKHIEEGAEVYTDALASYTGLEAEYVHQVIDHAECYAKGHVHTNGLENFWSLLKRCIHGTYVAVEPFHLFRYLDEQSFRFNMRKLTDGERFLLGLNRIRGKHLTYNHLIGDDMEDRSAADDKGAAD